MSQANMKQAFLSLGSNLGNRKKNLLRALQYIGIGIGEINQQSGIYETEPWGFESDQSFYNLVIEVFSELSPLEMLYKCMEIEKSLGRIRLKTEGYASRGIDIDILFYDDEIIDLPELTIPHPHLQNRKFILAPLCEISPQLIHPSMEITIEKLLANCVDECEVIRLDADFSDL